MPKEAPSPARGVGDAVAWLIEKLSFGRLKESNTCGCQRRRAWLNRVFPFARRREPEISERTRRPAPRVLLRFPHGLGDAVQLTTVLLHLRALRPEWSIDIEAKPGAASLFHGLVRRVCVMGQDRFSSTDYDLIHTLAWDEPDACYRHSPSTKAERSLREVFSIAPLERWCRYEIQVRPAARESAVAYLTEFTGAKPNAQRRLPVMIVHYQGNSARQRKNLNEHTVRLAIDRAISLGYKVVLLDFEAPPRSGILREPSPHWPEGAVACPGVEHPLWQGLGSGDAETIAALIDSAALFVGIDSGPGHVAGATSTASIIVWTGHHPVHYYGLSSNVTHLVPHNHEEHLRGDASAGRDYFARSYDHRLYRQLSTALPRLVEEKLTPASPLIMDGDLWVRAAHRAADMVIVRDVFWNDAYRLGELRIRPQNVLDVGAHVGAFAHRARQRWPFTEIACVEANPANLAALNANVADFARVLPYAASYASSPARLISTVHEGTENTGGSFLWEDHAAKSDVSPEWRDRAVEVPTLDLEAIMAQLAWEQIDLFKLDCEGCEFCLLENTSSLEKIGVIVGEFHDRERFQRLVADRFEDWECTILLDSEPGLFRLVNPARPLPRE